MSPGRSSRIRLWFLIASIVFLGGVWQGIALAQPLSQPLSLPLSLLDIPPDRPLGEYTSYLRETGAPLTLAEAMAAHAAGRFAPGTHPVLNFGSGQQAIWIRLEIANPTKGRLERRILVENPWLDQLDMYFVKAHQPVESYSSGDNHIFRDRPIPGRFFSFNHRYDPGVTDVFLRVETLGSIELPMYFLSAEEASRRDSSQSYYYGFIYGYLIALMAYNLLLFLSLRNKHYLLYAVFMAAFMSVSIASTGHGYAWLWPEETAIQRVIIPILMVVFCTSGLAFAVEFLNTRLCFPRGYKILAAICTVAVLLQTITLLTGNLHYSIDVAFSYIVIFPFLMLALGVASLKSDEKFSRYFLLATIASMVGTIITILSIWGYIPIYSYWNIRAAEIGMLVDATLLAFALAQQFRLTQLDHLRAEALANSDPLTGINNRRAFLDKAHHFWAGAQRSGKVLSVIMIDIDHFKRINDRHGHEIGDEVLVATANLLTTTVRQGDIVCRWGGEEFLLLLPDLDLAAAISMAERLRTEIAALRLPQPPGEVRITASFGVAQKTAQETLAVLLSTADGLLYQAKQTGRNRVCAAPDRPSDSAGDMPAADLASPPRAA